MDTVDSPPLTFSKPLTWLEVFAQWRHNEANNPNWVREAHLRGYASWEEWRLEYARAWKYAERTWELYQVGDPLQTVPTWQGGPFKTWVERYYGEALAPTFAELAQRADLHQHPIITKLLHNFPATTYLMGLRQDGQITVLEGMHRAVALAIAAQQHQPVQTQLFIALTDAPGEHWPVIGQFSKGAS